MNRREFFAANAALVASQALPAVSPCEHELDFSTLCCRKCGAEKKQIFIDLAKAPEAAKNFVRCTRIFNGVKQVWTDGKWVKYVRVHRIHR